jgi:predicted amidophosphoribosyltransferase
MKTNLITCPACGKQVSKNAAACPNCAEPIAPTRNNTQGINFKDPVHIAGVILAALIFGGTVLAVAVAIFAG